MVMTFIMLCKVVLFFQSVNDILKRDYLAKKSFLIALLTLGVLKSAEG